MSRSSGPRSTWTARASVHMSRFERRNLSDLPRMIDPSQTEVVFMADRLCAVPGCNKLLYAKGLCHPHYKRKRRTGDVQADKGIGERVTQVCSVDGCENVATE